MSLLEVVSEICRLQDLRAKVMQDDTGCVYIFDCLHWTEQCAYMLRFLLPNAVLTVEESVSSLSHFVIAVRSEPVAQISRRRMLTAALLTLAVYLCLLYFRFYHNTRTSSV